MALKRRKKPEETVCLTGTQMEHIIDAARGKKGACPKAKQFVNSFRPEVKKEGLETINFLEKKLDQTLDRVLKEFSSWF